jgi:hypothetical protein
VHHRRVPRPLTRRAGRLATAALLLLLAPALPAAAHEGDPRVVTELAEVSPALPDGVVVQVQASLAAQLVADNPTPAPLEVLDEAGRPFLRLSAAGVEADVASPAFLATSSPSGVVPPAAGGPARWRTISTGTSWGWFDHRLHPERLAAPPDTTRAVELGTWSVPLRYDGEPVEVRGRTRFQPLLGGFAVTADPGPAGVVVQVLPGRLPGLRVEPPPGRTLLVRGADGEPYARLGPQGLEVNSASRTHVEDRAARGELVDPPAPGPRWTPPDPSVTAHTWLDARLRYPEDLPPDDVLRRGEPVVLQRWSVPVEVDGAPAALTGEVRWVPDPAGQAAAGATGADGAGAPAAAWLLAAAVGALVGAVVLLRRRAVRR